MLTLKQFQYFIKLLKKGALLLQKKLFIAQSALSRQMKLLEEKLIFSYLIVLIRK